MTTEEWVLFFEDLREPSDEDITQIRAALWRKEDADVIFRAHAFHKWLHRWHLTIVGWGERSGYYRRLYAEK